MLTFSVHELLIWAKVEVRRGGVESTVVDVSGRKEMATHSSVLAWRNPGTGEPGGLPSLGSHRVGHD